MSRIAFIVLSLFVAGAAQADRVKDSIVSQLRAQGFTKIEVSRTFLGRSRVKAQSPTLDREIVFNPMTGAIMRDYSTPRDDATVPEVTIVDPNSETTKAAAVHSREAGDAGDDNGAGSEGSGDSGGDSGDSGGDSGSDSGDSGGGSGGDSGDGGGDSGGDAGESGDG